MHIHPLISWRSILGGLFITGFALAVLLALGIAIGGVGLQNGTDAQSAGIFTGAWFLVSSVIALFLGSYFAARISPFHTNRVGSAHGIVIASLFFGFLLYQTFAAVGFLGRTAGSAVGSAAGTAGAGLSQLAQNPMVTELIEDGMADLNLRSEPQVVVSGVASRLMRGNTEGAKNFLARQAGITPAEADQRIAALRASVDAALVEARETTAAAMRATGWALFIAHVLGAVAAIIGGALGARANHMKPISVEQADLAGGLRPATI